MTKNIALGPLEVISGAYFIFLIKAIMRDDLKLRTNLINIFSTDDSKIALSFFLSSVLYIIYMTKYSDISHNEKIRLTNAFKGAIIAFMIAIGARVGLWVAPYFLTLMVFLHPNIL